MASLRMLSSFDGGADRVSRHGSWILPPLRKTFLSARSCNLLVTGTSRPRDAGILARQFRERVEMRQGTRGDGGRGQSGLPIRSAQASDS
jgi:hypothetical protein